MVKKRLFYSYVIDKVLAGNQEIEENFRISKAHDFVVTHIVGSATSTTYEIRFRDSVTNRQWSDGLMNALNSIGTANYPFKLAKPRFLPKNSYLYHRLKDGSGSSNTVQVVLHGYEIKDVPDMPKLPRPVSRKSFAYVIDAVRTAAQRNEESIEISGAHDFVVTHITGNTTNAYKVQFRDTGNNKNWFSAGILNANIIGTANLPYILPKPKFIKAGSTLFYDILDSGSGSTLEIVLHGYEIPV